MKRLVYLIFFVFSMVCNVDVFADDNEGSNQKDSKSFSSIDNTNKKDFHYKNVAVLTASSVKFVSNAFMFAFDLVPDGESLKKDLIMMGGICDTFPTMVEAYFCNYDKTKPLGAKFYTREFENYGGKFGLFDVEDPGVILIYLPKVRSEGDGSVTSEVKNGFESGKNDFSIAYKELDDYYVFVLGDSLDEKKLLGMSTEDKIFKDMCDTSVFKTEVAKNALVTLELGEDFLKQDSYNAIVGYFEMYGRGDANEAFRKFKESFAKLDEVVAIERMKMALYLDLEKGLQVDTIVTYKNKEFVEKLKKTSLLTKDEVLKQVNEKSLLSTYVDLEIANDCGNWLNLIYDVFSNFVKMFRAEAHGDEFLATLDSVEKVINEAYEVFRILRSQNIHVSESILGGFNVVSRSKPKAGILPENMKTKYEEAFSLFSDICNTVVPITNSVSGCVDGKVFINTSNLLKDLLLAGGGTKERALRDVEEITTLDNVMGLGIFNGEKEIFFTSDNSYVYVSCSKKEKGETAVAEYKSDMLSPRNEKINQLLSGDRYDDYKYFGCSYANITTILNTVLGRSKKLFTESKGIVSIDGVDKNGSIVNFVSWDKTGMKNTVEMFFHLYNKMCSEESEIFTTKEEFDAYEEEIK